jgi:hypothetical protein
VRVTVAGDESLKGRFVGVVVEGADESTTSGSVVPGSAR